MSKRITSRSSMRKVISLEKLYGDNPQSLAHYKKKLLQPGWAGELPPYEFAYVKSGLAQSPSLKRRWGFRRSAKRFSEARIKAVARNGL